MKTVQVENATWKQLMKIKVDTGAKNLDEVISALLPKEDKRLK